MPRRAQGDQSELFGQATLVPDGFAYAGEILSGGEEKGLVERIRGLAFAPFDFHGFLGKRRIVSFGWRYDYSGRALRESLALPNFLMPLRARAARFAKVPADSFQQALVTEYAPGAGIGWHKDKPMFEDVVAFSFLAACTLRFRKKKHDGGWDRLAVEAQPRSAYLLRGAARREWEHSIPPVAQLRYSVTFRNFVA